jgi:hypothetical protein
MYVHSARAKRPCVRETINMFYMLFKLVFNSTATSLVEVKIDALIQLHLCTRLNSTGVVCVFINLACDHSYSPIEVVPSLLIYFVITSTLQ